MKKSVIAVSDHAVLRYLEQVNGVDVEAVRRHIGRAVDVATAHEGASAVVANGIRFHLRDDTVVTVAPATSPDKRTGCVRRRSKGNA